jgi:putative heme iron utilization protein
MNADHADALKLYATELLGAPAGDWRCVGLTPEGIELQQGGTAAWLAFPQRVTGPRPLRAMLKDLAERARAG